MLYLRALEWRYWDLELFLGGKKKERERRNYYSCWTAEQDEKRSWVKVTAAFISLVFSRHSALALPLFPPFWLFPFPAASFDGVSAGEKRCQSRGGWLREDCVSLLGAGEPELRHLITLQNCLPIFWNK